MRPDPAARQRARQRRCGACSCSRVHALTPVLNCAVQINAGAETLDGEEFGDDNFDFDEDAAVDSDHDHNNIDDI